MEIPVRYYISCHSTPTKGCHLHCTLEETGWVRFGVDFMGLAGKKFLYYIATLRKYKQENNLKFVYNLLFYLILIFSITI